MAVTATQRALLLSLLESPDPEVTGQGLALAEALGPEAICQLLSGFRLSRWGSFERSDGRYTRAGGALLQLLLTTPGPLPPALRRDRIRRLWAAWPLTERALDGLRQLPALQQLRAVSPRGAPIDGLHTLINLRELDLSHAADRLAPPGIAGLARLHRLSLGGAVPEAVADLRRLQEVTVRGKDLSLAPLAALPRLRRLELRVFGSGDQLGSLGQPPALRALLLEGGRMPAAPEALFQLTGLTELTLRATSLAALDARLGHLAGLRELCILNSTLPSLPAEIGALQELRILQVEWARLTALPDEVGDLSELRELRLGHNRLLTLPASLRGLPRLERLHLSDNGLSKLSSQVRIPSLKVLHLAENQLSTIPYAPAGLRELGLARNRITHLSVVHDLGASLVKLDLSGNRIRDLRYGQPLMPRLVTLKLSGNRIGDVALSADKMPALQSLDLSHNPITRLPEAMAALPLQHLCLDWSLRGAVPGWIGDVPTLRQLSLRGCGLTRLPPFLAQMTRLQHLDLRDNPLDNPATQARLRDRMPQTLVRFTP